MATVWTMIKMHSMPSHRQAAKNTRPSRRRIRPRIVIADDNPTSLQWICEVLEKHFDVVAQATNGVECLDAVQRFSPSLVVTDVSMPKMNGIDATRQITRKWPTIKVVIVSVFSDPYSVDAAIEAGASSYVSKLSGDEELVSTIQNVLSGTTFQSAI